MEEYESYYRLFKSSWGILIGFRGTIVNDIEQMDSSIIKINNRLSLKLNIPAQNKYIHDNKELIKNGILWVSDIIPNEGKKVIELNTVDLNFCNFQIEGLFFGIANWVCNYYQVSMPDYNYKYDNVNNNYIFWFDDDDKNSKYLLYP